MPSRRPAQAVSPKPSHRGTAAYAASSSPLYWGENLGWPWALRNAPGARNPEYIVDALAPPLHQHGHGGSMHQRLASHLQRQLPVVIKWCRIIIYMSASLP
eukprot:scaffold593_cov382-Prasinococcus_capsulatus_cf.AAC.32